MYTSQEAKRFYTLCFSSSFLGIHSELSPKHLYFRSRSFNIYVGNSRVQVFMDLMDLMIRWSLGIQ